MLEWLESLFLRKQPSRDIEQPILAGDSIALDMREDDDSEDSEDDLEEANRRLAQEVFERARSQCRQDEPNFYFDMFKTTEHRVRNAAPVSVWWMAKTHPYARFLMQLRREQWVKHRRLVFDPYCPHDTIFGVPEDMIDKAVDILVDMCQKYKLINVQYEDDEQQQAKDDSECTLYAQ